MPRILFIDDEEPIRIVAGTLLQFAGHEVVTAVDGQQGVELFRQQTFDLVITDLVMPRMGGEETIAVLRKLRPGIKIIATFGGGWVFGVDSVTAAKHLGADAMLPKPFSRGELLAALSAVWSGAKKDPACS